MARHLNRRRFLRQAAAATGTSFALAAYVRQAGAAGDKIRVACIGVGGRGAANTTAMAGEEMVALCDVDEGALNAMAKKFPQAKKYRDFRKLLDEEKGLDAAVISTPDHCHALATLRAIDRGLHVYCEKPLTRTVYEARRVAQAVAAKKVITQMGTGGQAHENFMKTVEAIQAGAIGAVREVHIWTNRPIWPQGQDRLSGADPVPAALDWDLWIGPAPMRPFKDKYPDGPFKGKNIYHPFVWRGWWDFGTGALGDIAPHAMNVAFWALKLGAPQSVEAECSGMKPEAFPEWSIIRFSFPQRGDLPPVKLVWYDGGKRAPAELFGGGTVGDSGTLFLGDKGRIFNDRLGPDKDFANYKYPTPTQTRYDDVQKDWIAAVKQNRPAGCRFEYSAPMTEAYLLGNIALKVGKKIEWDPQALRVTNCPEANAFIKGDYRKGWELG